MTELEVLKRYHNGREKYSSIIGRMNIELHWTKFASKAGIIEQLSQDTHDEITVFYMVSEADAFTGETYHQIHKEYFKKIKVAG